MRTAPQFHLPFLHSVTERERNFALGLWRLIDPKIAIASVVPFIVGMTLSVDTGVVISWGLAGAAFLAIFLVEVGKNAVNDLFDFEADAAVRPEERSPFSGGKRVLVDRLLTRYDLVIIAWVAFALAGVVGLEIASRSRAALLLLGAAAAVISIVYAMPPIKLSARGLGELAVFAVYGPGIVLGAMLLQNAPVSREAVLASIVFGLLIANVLLINEVPDERADRAAGKRTLVVRFGRERSETLIAMVFSCAVAIPVLAAAYGYGPFRLTAFLAIVPTAVVAVSLLRRSRSVPPVAAQAATLTTYVIAGLAYATAILIL